MRYLVIHLELDGSNVSPDGDGEAEPVVRRVIPCETSKEIFKTISEIEDRNDNWSLFEDKGFRLERRAITWSVNDVTIL